MSTKAMPRGVYPEDLPGEDWRPMKPPYGAWLVSSHGRIWSMRWRKLLSPYVEKVSDKRRRPRLIVKLPSDPMFGVNIGRTAGGNYAYRQTGRGVADEVLEAFVGPKPSRAHGASFKDGDHMNCHVGNLEWAIMPQMRPRGGTSKRQQQRLAQQAREAAK